MKYFNLNNLNHLWVEAQFTKLYSFNWYCIGIPVLPHKPISNRLLQKVVVLGQFFFHFLTEADITKTIFKPNTMNISHRVKQKQLYLLWASIHCTKGYAMQLKSNFIWGYLRHSVSGFLVILDWLRESHSVLPQSTHYPQTKKHKYYHVMISLWRPDTPGVCNYIVLMAHKKKNKSIKKIYQMEWGENNYLNFHSSAKRAEGSQNVF